MKKAMTGNGIKKRKFVRENKIVKVFMFSDI